MSSDVNGSSSSSEIESAEQDEEFEIVDIIEGDGNRSGMFGYAILRDKNGKTFRSSSRGNHEFYSRILKDKATLIGKSVTVRFQNYTPDEKIPRFPVIVNWDRNNYYLQSNTPSTCSHSF